MSLNFRFAVLSDLHIALPHTILNQANRFHLVEISIPALELVLEHLKHLNLDFLLLPGDLTQDGEPDNHAWLQKQLAELPFPVYVIPGNHDVPTLLPNERSIGLKDFPHYYRQFGYTNPNQLYYTCELLPGVQLIGLNSNFFDESGKQVGRLDEAQLAWLDQTLAQLKNQLVLVMVHHNVVEHLPGQTNHPLGRRYMLENAPTLVKLLKASGVNLVFTGHLHVQDIACHEGIYDITTGSLVSYPHPYRILELRTDNQGNHWLQIESHRVESVPGWENLHQTSREWMGDRSQPFMIKLLTAPPLSLPLADAQQLAPSLRYFWADVAAGDASFDFPNFPLDVRRYFQTFSATSSDGKATPIDNHTTLLL
ncbi:MULTISPECIES: metallophosphoesterase family protein [unclassified Coleofasciculus]|uniref:metallophosphoesterase family protein n=1 Tax=unclassified Coleofasciculus TaxID=2692782 RepID=UPI001881E1A5|nr:MULTISPECIES: metallophosphoesterase [unclassified Coleofasciculus]MBE9129287.1 metallophosphoesterase [Coleofasciculus sp. LEGE 07081]MBE9151929.1 metallophosphoesterase [Coleofasciculus sp. LEGE 07092]